MFEKEFGLKNRAFTVLYLFYDVINLSHILTLTPAGPVSPPVLIFMKKIWMNATPGLDKLADVMFHFPQVIMITLFPTVL